MCVCVIGVHDEIKLTVATERIEDSDFCYTEKRVIFGSDTVVLTDVVLSSC